MYVRIKASERRLRFTKRSSVFDIEWAAAGTHALACHLIINKLGATDSHQLCVAALAKGTTISCELRLDLARISSPECDILGRRVNKLSRLYLVATGSIELPSSPV